MLTTSRRPPNDKAYLLPVSVRVGRDRHFKMITKAHAILEINHKRGVIYVHLTKKKDIEKYQLVTAVRICNLGVIPPLETKMIDLRHLKPQTE